MSDLLKRCREAHLLSLRSVDTTVGVLVSAICSVVDQNKDSLEAYLLEEFGKHKKVATVLTWPVGETIKIGAAQHEFPVYACMPGEPWHAGKLEWFVSSNLRKIQDAVERRLLQTLGVPGGTLFIYGLGEGAVGLCVEMRI